MPAPIIEVRGLSKHFAHIAALSSVSMTLERGEVHCLLGDNGAGKSTLIRTLSGYFKPTSGEVLFEGTPVHFNSPGDALDRGIATVYQDLGLVPLMSVMRNFFMGREPVRDFGPFKVLKKAAARSIAREEMMKIGIDLRDPDEPVGTMSGGERQSLAIARAVYFGAKVLILDEPTSALGVRQTSTVLKYVAQLREQGIGIIFITHNVRHAYAVGNRFTVLNRGRALGTFSRDEKTRGELEELMAGGKEMADLTENLRGNKRPVLAAETGP
jgi:simple sugar transport system ATP-binding protein